MRRSAMSMDAVAGRPSGGVALRPESVAIAVLVAVRIPRVLRSVVTRDGRRPFSFLKRVLPLLAILVAVPATAHAQAITPIQLNGEMIGGGIVVDASGTPTTNTSGCGTSLISGCLVVGTGSTTNIATPIVVSDGFQLVDPVPPEWRQLEQAAEATVASLRGVPAERR